jgi:hypothetical protein
MNPRGIDLGIPVEVSKCYQSNMPFTTEKIDDPFEIIREFTVSVRSEPTVVWRGQSWSEWGLTPSLFRSEPKWRNWTWDSKEDQLLRYCEKSNAKWVRDHYPEGFVEHLTLAQHQRLPTRLLDWTESPLIALFFACSDVVDAPNEVTDGALWRLHTNAVRLRLGEDNEERRRLPDGTYTPAIPAHTPNGLNGEFDTFLFYPKRLHARQISQLAAYTVHPNPSPGSSGDFSRKLRPEENLVRYIFPAETKHKVFAKLWSLGIRYENMFPDIEGAAKGAKYVIDVEDNSLWTETRTFGGSQKAAPEK